MITATYYPEDPNYHGSAKNSRDGFKCTRDAMVWIFNDAVSKYDISTRVPLHGFWFWYKLEKNGKEYGNNLYLIRPLLKGKNKGKPAMFRWDDYASSGLYRLKSKSF